MALWYLKYKTNLKQSKTKKPQIMAALLLRINLVIETTTHFGAESNSEHTRLGWTMWLLVDIRVAT